MDRFSTSVIVWIVPLKLYPGVSCFWWLLIFVGWPGRTPFSRAENPPIAFICELKKQVRLGRVLLGEDKPAISDRAGVVHGISNPNPAHNARRRLEARHLNLAGFLFGFAGRGDLLTLLLMPVLLEDSRGRRLRKSGRPPPLEPSLKVQRDIAHNQSSGFAVAPGSKASTRAGL